MEHNAESMPITKIYLQLTFRGSDIVLSEKIQYLSDVRAQMKNGWIRV